VGWRKRTSGCKGGLQKIRSLQKFCTTSKPEVLTGIPHTGDTLCRRRVLKIISNVRAKEFLEQIDKYEP